MPLGVTINWDMSSNWHQRVRTHLHAHSLNQMMANSTFFSSLEINCLEMMSGINTIATAVVSNATKIEKDGLCTSIRLQI